FANSEACRSLLAHSRRMSIVFGSSTVAFPLASQTKSRFALNGSFVQTLAWILAPANGLSSGPSTVTRSVRAAVFAASSRGPAGAPRPRPARSSRPARQPIAASCAFMPGIVLAPNQGRKAELRQVHGYNREPRLRKNLGCSKAELSKAQLYPTII